jgi:hypothetical protein
VSTIPVRAGGAVDRLASHRSTVEVCVAMSESGKPSLDDRK